MLARRTLIAAGSAAGAVTAAGCAGDPPPRDTFYRLVSSDPAQVFPLPPLDAVVEVERFTATGILADRALVYAAGSPPDTVRRYDYDFWTEPPPALLQNALVTQLRDANVATRIVTPGLRASPGYSVKGHIDRFEQVLEGPERASVAIEMELSLTRLSDNRIFVLQTYRATQPLPDQRVSPAVGALNAAIAGIFDAFIEDIDRALAGG